jgi:uncharacterized membrane protein
MSQSCSYRINKESNSFEKATFSEELLENVSYSEVKNKVFTPKCIFCHGNSGGVNLENYADTKSHIDAIAQSTLKEKRMPQSGSEPLSSEEYNLLAAWIKAGGPEYPLNGKKEEETPTPPEIEVLRPEFSSIKKLIIDKKCTLCHKAGGSASRIPLDTVEAMIDSPLEIVIPGNPDESGLVLTLDRKNAINPMPPIYSGISEVSPEELEIVKEWIQKLKK